MCHCSWLQFFERWVCVHLSLSCATWRVLLNLRPYAVPGCFLPSAACLLPPCCSHYHPFCLRLILPRCEPDWLCRLWLLDAWLLPSLLFSCEVAAGAASCMTASLSPSTALAAPPDGSACTGCPGHGCLLASGLLTQHNERCTHRAAFAQMIQKLPDRCQRLPAASAWLLAAMREKKRLLSFSTFFKSDCWSVLYCKHCTQADRRHESARSQHARHL